MNIELNTEDLSQKITDAVQAAAARVIDGHFKTDRWNRPEIMDRLDVILREMISDSLTDAGFLAALAEQVRAGMLEAAREKGRAKGKRMTADQIEALSK